MEPKFQRRLFLSHVSLAVIAGTPFSPSTQPDLNELYGNIYVDLKNQNLCVNCEGVYVELTSGLLEYWKTTAMKLTASH